MTMSGEPKIPKGFVMIYTETPYYYRHELDCGSVIHGKVLDDRAVSMRKTTWYNDGISYEFTVEMRKNFNSLTTYLTQKRYKSSEKEFRAALVEMQEFVKAWQGGEQPSKVR